MREEVRAIHRCQYRILLTPVDRWFALANNAQLRTPRCCCLCGEVCVFLHLDAEHINISDACHTVHEHVQQSMIMSTNDPWSIPLKENRARTGHFAVRQQLHSISSSSAQKHQDIKKWKNFSFFFEK